jgi:hypothetical protein
MFGLFRSSHPQPKKSVSRQSRPRLEQLEDRYCPAAAMVSYLAAYSCGNWVTVYGQVSDESPETAQVILGGSLNAVVVPDSSGYFDYTDYVFGSGSADPGPWSGDRRDAERKDGLAVGGGQR